MSENDFFDLYKGIKAEDYKRLIDAKNAEGVRYNVVELPLTSKNAEGLDEKGNYLNYYIANTVVLMPTYNDVKDEITRQILAKIYPNKEIITIDVAKLYKYGGMVHCVTQQQPL